MNKLGEFETLNFSIGIIPEDIALFHALYRTSIKGRRDLVKVLFQDSKSGDGIQKIDSSYTSRVAEIFSVILKALGIRLEFVNKDDIIYPLNKDIIKDHEMGDLLYLCTDYDFYKIQKEEEIRKEILEENTMMTTEELDKQVDEEMTNLGL